MRIDINKNMVVLVDRRDFGRLSKLHWYLSAGGYAIRRTSRSDGPRRVIYMHKEILPTDQEVDHKNGNRLDNRRSNLRACSHKMNLRNFSKPKSNTSGFKGVHKHPSANRWVAQIRTDDGKKYLGLFLSAELAAKAYDNAAKKHHGEFAKLNFPARREVQE